MKHKGKIMIGVLSCLIVLTASGCATYKTVEKIPEGATRERILLKSYPTEARIFIDKKYLGKTPVKTDLWYFKPRRVNIIAEPLHEQQIPQNLVIAIPDVPDKIVFYMNFNPERFYQSEEQDPAQLFLPMIYFEADTYSLDIDDTGKLDELAEYIRQEESVVLEIHGYAGQTGVSDDQNTALSMKRTQAVYQYLIERGVGANRMDVSGHGASPTPDSASVDPEYRKNQRVEFDLRNVNEEHTQ